jgi:hypothetical protein
MSAAENRPWKLRELLDSLVVELDRAQDTLAVKALNRPLSYTVKDVGLDLQIFPAYDGDAVRFTTARPGQSGASKINVTLGSITDRMIRETAPPPPTADDVVLEDLPDLDPGTKKALSTAGITSARDLDRMEQNQIVIKRVDDRPLDYGHLADVINRARRGAAPPTVHSVSLEGTPADAFLRVRGTNLRPLTRSDGFPAARLGDRVARVLSATDQEVRIGVEPGRLGPAGELRIALDPWAVVRMQLGKG